MLICAKQRKFSVFCMYRGDPIRETGRGIIRCDVPGGCPSQKWDFADPVFSNTPADRLKGLA